MYICPDSDDSLKGLCSVLIERIFIYTSTIAHTKTTEMGSEFHLCLLHESTLWTAALSKLKKEEENKMEHLFDQVIRRPKEHIISCAQAWSSHCKTRERPMPLPCFSPFLSFAVRMIEKHENATGFVSLVVNVALNLLTFIQDQDTLELFVVYLAHIWRDCPEGSSATLLRDYAIVVLSKLRYDKNPDKRILSFSAADLKNLVLTSSLPNSSSEVNPCSIIVDWCGNHNRKFNDVSKPLSRTPRNPVVFIRQLINFSRFVDIDEKRRFLEQVAPTLLAASLDSCMVSFTSNAPHFTG